MLKQLWHYGATPVKEATAGVLVAFLGGAVCGIVIGRLIERLSCS